MDNKIHLTETHSGRVRLTTLSEGESTRISLLLVSRYGFLRDGADVPPITDEAIYPSYIKGELKIEAGWDSWFGYDWFADNDATDKFLMEFYHKHCE